MGRSCSGYLHIVLMGLLPLAFANASVAGDLVVTRLVGSTADARYFAISRVGGDTSTDDQIRWLHRTQWAAQGGYRFRDPALMEYFTGFPWYSPVPERIWKSWIAQPWMKNPDAPLLRTNRPSHPAGAYGESLEAILRAERTRGLSPPEL